MACEHRLDVKGFMCLLRILSFLLSFYTITAYHQDDYVVKLNIIEMKYINPIYATNVTAGRTWYNRTTPVISGSGLLMKDLGKHVKIEIQSYKFLSNEYRFFPVTMTLDGCEERTKNNFGIKETVDKCTNIGFCPIKKGSYYVRDCVVDFTQFPPLIPRGNYLLNFKLYNGGDLVLEIDVRHSIEDKKKY